MSYVLPQVQVFQEFTQVPTAVVEYLYAFVFGANYYLARYSVASEKATIGVGTYDPDNDTTYSYPSQTAGTTVDTDYVALYMDNVWAEYEQITQAVANPLVMVGPSDRNKLRAMPVIEDPENGVATELQFGTTTNSLYGYFTGHVPLPEYYYFYPVGGADGSGNWGASYYTADIASESGRLNYLTSEGLTGYVTIDKANTPLTEGVFTAGPDGMHIDLDNDGADANLRQDSTLTFTDGVASFTMKLDMANLADDFADELIDNSLNTMVNISLADAGGDSISWNAVTRVLTIVAGDTASGDDLSSMYLALTTDSDVAALFNFTAISGTPTGNEITAVTDDAAVSVATGVNVNLIHNIYRIRVSANPYIFSTGNSVSHTSQFKSRGVQVGDRVRYTVTDDSSVVHTGTSRITGFEADYSLAAVADMVGNAANQATQNATSLPSAGTAVLTAGSDNQRQFNGASTAVTYLADSSVTAFPGDLSNGIVSENWTITITTQGVAGTAKASVVSESGTYSRTNVLIENAGSNNGVLYIGHELYVDFDQGATDGDAIFQLGDTYTVTTDVTAAHTALTTSNVTTAGTYTGPSDTTYVVEVTRGGVFDRTVGATKGNTAATTAVLTPSITWDNWLGGDVFDEYIFECTTAGTLTTSVWKATSLRGENQTGIQFTATATNVAVGARGLQAQLDVDDTFTVGDYWVIRVNAARPQVKISDTAGVDNGGYSVVNDGTAVDLGDYGATITFAANTNTEGGIATNGGLLKGDIYTVSATASNAAALRTIVLADDLPADVSGGYVTSTTTDPSPNLVGIWLYLVQSSATIPTKNGASPGDYNWTAASTGITVNDDIMVQDSSWYNGDGSLPYLPVYTGDLYVEYRSLITTYSDTIHSLTDINDVATTLGTIHPDNPLAQGMYNALSNSGDRLVYYTAVDSDDSTGFSAALRRASLSEDVYAFAPLTQNTTILNSVEAHINDMSTETNKRWRIAFVGTDMTTSDGVYDSTTHPISGTNWLALVEDDPAVAGSQYTIVKMVDSDGDTDTNAAFLTDLAAGDKVRINYATDAWGDATYEEYTVSSIVSNNQLKLTSGPSAPIANPTKVEIWHDYSVQAMANGVKATSEGFNNRRIYHVFPDALYLDSVLQTSEFGAAAVAGLCSSVPPQQGLTNISLNGFDDIPAVYSTFSFDQLNTIAEGGTLIIMQDVAAGNIYIRHQISTAYQQGNLNTTELSITKNLDSISYYFADLLAPFIGRYNITPELIEVIRTQINDGLFYLGSLTSVGLLGPQLILENGDTELVSLEQHATLKDRLIARVNLDLPYPLNVIELHLVV